VKIGGLRLGGHDKSCIPNPALGRSLAPPVTARSRRKMAGGPHLNTSKKSGAPRLAFETWVSAPPNPSVPPQVQNSTTEAHMATLTLTIDPALLEAAKLEADRRHTTSIS
jgi:hypothetical protein